MSIDASAKEFDDRTVEAYVGQFGLLLKEDGFNGVKVSFGREALLGKKSFQLEQKLGERTLVLGHDGNNVWIGLEGQGPGNPPTWDQNSEIKTGQEYQNVTIEPNGDALRVRISAKHAAASLLSVAHVLGYQPELRMANQANNFQIDKSPVATETEEGDWEFTVPPGPAKLVLVGLPASWQDGEWSYGKVQKLAIRPPQNK